MKNHIKNYLVFVILISVLIAPSFALASWYNPFSWHIWSNFWNYFFQKQTPTTQPTEPTACTEEAKVCPDGSTVGRTGPNCEFTQCPNQTAQPSITITSPNGGETFNKGQDIVVKWNSSSVNKVYIWADYYNSNGVVDPTNPMNGGECRITYESVSSTGSFTIVGGNTGRCGVLSESNMIKIRIQDADPNYSNVIDASNNYFNIVASTAQPSITITSPSGGKTFVFGQTIPITWTSTGVDKVLISAYYYDANGAIGIPDGTNYSFNEGQCRLTYESISATQGNFIANNGGRCGLMPIGTRIKFQITGLNNDNSQVLINGKALQAQSNYFGIVGQ